MFANLTKQPRKPIADKGKATAMALLMAPLSGSNPTCCYCKQSHSQDRHEGGCQEANTTQMWTLFGMPQKRTHQPVIVPDVEVDIM